MHRVVIFATLLVTVLSSSCSTEAQICGRMETLCGTPREECKELVRSTKESLGEDGVHSMKPCFSEATTCGEAGGCVAAKGLKNVGAAVGEFFKGLKKGLEEKKER